MSDNSVSEFGKSVSGDDMSSIALNEAKTWHDKLMDAEFRGRGDREKSARGRLADKTGIPESYLYRLAYKTAEMKDVAGSVYRSLMLAYEDMCERNERAAAEYRAERLQIEEDDAVMAKLDGALAGVAKAPACAETER